ncbi:MAG TPA: hypothetical protein VF648_00615 [Pyrinomonadaceae bacterium]|jgi:hypothetical protein
MKNKNLINPALEIQRAVERELKNRPNVEQVETVMIVGSEQIKIIGRAKLIPEPEEITVHIDTVAIPDGFFKQ